MIACILGPRVSKTFFKKLEVMISKQKVDDLILATMSRKKEETQAQTG